MCYSRVISRLVPQDIIPVQCIGRTSFQIPSRTLCGPWEGEGQDIAPTPNRGGALRARTRVGTWGPVGGKPSSQTHTHSLKNARCVTPKMGPQARPGAPRQSRTNT